MSKYIKLATGEVKTQGEWRATNKHVSLPKVWKAATLESLGLTPVLAAPKPSVTELQRVESAGTTTDALGNTVEAWAVVDKFATLLEDGYVVKSKVEQEAVYMAELAAKELEGKVAAIEATFAEQVKQLTVGYSEDEIKTWDKQVAEAAAYTANAAAPTPLLDALIGVTGDAKADLVGKVLNKANAYSAVLGAALGIKQKDIKELN